MWDQFSDDSKKLMSFARRAAVELQHDTIDAEHVLLGLLAIGGGSSAGRVLAALEVDPDKLREDLVARITPGAKPVTEGQLPFTQRSKRVLEAAMEQAQNLRHPYIGSDHLLLGLLAEHEGLATGEEGGAAGAALWAAGVTLEVASEAVSRLRGDAVREFALERTRAKLTPRIGDVLIQAEDRGPPGPDWLPCEGQSLPRAEHEELFAIVQERFGPAADGASFRLPDHRGMFATVTEGGSVRALRLGPAREGEEGTTQPLRFWVRAK